MFRLLTLIFLLLSSLSALAQQPKAVITGPKEARCGALVVLDATESQGLGRLWLLAVSPEETSFLPVESGCKCIFASPTAGRYEFVVVVSGTNANGGPAAEIARHTITLTGGQPPPPPPPPDDPNPFAVPAAELQTAAQPIVRIKTKRSDATNLANLYDQARRLVASAPAAIAAGTKPEIGTTAELRAWLVDNGKLLNLPGKYPGLAGAVDRFLGQQLGTAIRPVTATDADALAALAWGVWEASR